MSNRLLTEKDLSKYTANLPSFIQIMQKGGTKLNINPILEAQDAKTAEIVLKEVGRGEDCPKIICLCGSTRFTDIMLIKQWDLTKQGNIVLSWCALPDWYFDGTDNTHIGDQEGVKEIVDGVHFRKIDIADEVLVINKNYYIGESTANEIEYAKSIGKPVKYLVEALKKGEKPE